jgi:phosphate transport system substrate-binding protein
MSKENKKDKNNSTISGENDTEVPDTSFITNIKIDVSASPDRPSKTKPLKEKDPSFITNLGEKSPGRTTTLAIDPRPYKKRERVYTTIIVTLSIVVLIQSGWLIWLNFYNPKHWQVNIAGADVGHEQLETLAEAFMRKHLDRSIIITAKNERAALAELAQGQVQIVQTSFPLSADEKKQLTILADRQIKEIIAPKIAVGIYVSKNNPINELTLTQLQAIYNGEIDNWKSLGGEDAPIITCKLENSRSLDSFFEKQVIKNSSWLTKNKNYEGFISNNTFSSTTIGYAEVKDTNPNNTKLLKIKLNDNSEGISPQIGNKLNEQYPLIYNTYWYTTDLNMDILEFFLEEIKSKQK